MKSLNADRILEIAKIIAADQQAIIEHLNNR